MVGEANSSVRGPQNRKKLGPAVFFSQSRSILRVCNDFRFAAFSVGGDAFKGFAPVSAWRFSSL